MNQHDECTTILKTVRGPIDKQLTSLFSKAEKLTVEGWDSKRGNFTQTGFFARIGKEKILSVTMSKGRMTAIDTVIEVSLPRNVYLMAIPAGLASLGFKMRNLKRQQILALIKSEKLPLESRLNYAKYLLSTKEADLYFFEQHRKTKAHLVIHLKVTGSAATKLGKLAPTATAAKSQIIKLYRPLLRKP